MELKITKEKVLSAASKCSTAKATLETLFPEVFEDKQTFKQGDVFTVGSCLTYEVMICQSDSSIASLISIGECDKGNRWSHPYKVKDINSITPSEFKELLGDSKDKYESIIKTKR